MSVVFINCIMSSIWVSYRSFRDLVHDYRFCLLPAWTVWCIRLSDTLCVEIAWRSTWSVMLCVMELYIFSSNVKCVMSFVRESEMYEMKTCLYRYIMWQTYQESLNETEHLCPITCRQKSLKRKWSANETGKMCQYVVSEKTENIRAIFISIFAKCSFSIALSGSRSRVAFHNVNMNVRVFRSDEEIVCVVLVSRSNLDTVSWYSVIVWK